MQEVWVQVFNLRKLGRFDRGDLMSALLDAHYPALCAQYGLDPEGVPSILPRLELITASEEIAPFFLLKYLPDDQPPLVVYRWEADQESGARWLKSAELHAQQPLVMSHLGQTREILGVAMRPSQLQDMGLLLAYEVARWAAAAGQGLIYGLDGVWYRLNRHQAFLPLERV